MKRLTATTVLITYCALLIKVMVFKDMPTIHIGQLMFNFGGTNGDNPANFIPFMTIVPYLFGEQGLVIAGVNLLGNIALLVPVGLLAPLVFQKITWKRSLGLAVIAGLTIEIMQAVLNVGIFDIDDVILNALGVMVGYWIFSLFAQWIRAKQYAQMVAVILAVVIAIAGGLYALYPKDQPVIRPAERTVKLYLASPEPTCYPMTILTSWRRIG